MAIDLSDLMDLEVEVENEDKVNENQVNSDTTKEDVNAEIEAITKELEDKKNKEVDITENLPAGIDKEEFKKTHNALEKKAQNTELDPKVRQKVNQIKSSMDLTKASNISLYGSGSQEKISNYSRSVLEKTKSQDSGEVGSLLTDLMVTVKNTDIERQGEKSFFDRLFGGAKNKVESIIAKQQSIETQIDIISSKLLQSRDLLLKDVDMLDKLYEENLHYYDNIVTYIIAGKEIIDENNNEIIPNMLAEVEKLEDDAEKSKAIQQVRDYQSNINRFEKRIHDLEISRVVAVQMMPQLKLIQNNDQMLADKVQDAVVNTIPLWRTQFVMAISMERQKNVAELSRQVSEATDELIVRNAEILHDNSIEIKKEAERDIVSLESLEKSQQLLISTIEETLQIEEDARKARRESEVRMREMEHELREAAVRAIAKRDEMDNISLDRAKDRNLSLISG